MRNNQRRQPARVEDSHRPRVRRTLSSLCAVAAHVIAMGCTGTVVSSDDQAAAADPQRGRHTRSSSSGNPSTSSAACTLGGATSTPTSVAFPLRLSADKRTLIDQNDVPFLLVGDAAWSLPTALSESQTITYLDDRKQRGFNTILVAMMEHKFTARSPAWKNAQGEVPFDDNNDFTTTRAAFFDHVAWVVQQAAARGMVVLLTPAYIGYECGAEGWCQEMLANGVQKLTAYGQFVGQRFKDLPNIIWVEGGDLTPSTSGSPSQLDLINAVATGIKAGDGGAHLHTAHWSRGVSSSQGPSVPWLDLDATYSGQLRQTYTDCLDDWGRDQNLRPVFFFEGIYESERSSTTVDQRAQMYQPLLSGAMGFVFGNNPMWYFGGATDGNAGWSFATGGASSWQAALGSAGARHASIAADLFRSLAWAQLRPDTSHSILKAGYADSSPDRNVTLAATPDRKLAVAYFTSALTVTIDTSAFAGPVTATWYDPSSAASCTSTVVANDGNHSFSVPGDNTEGESDWVLVLRVL